MSKEKTKVLFVRIPESWVDKINEIAKNECRTQVSVARQAIKEYLEKFTSPIEFSSPDLKDFIGENKASLIISHNASSRIRKGVEQRDTAIKAGADGAIILVYEDELRFPVSDISLPEFKDKFFDLKKGDVVILGFADNYADAENGAIAIALDLI